MSNPYPTLMPDTHTGGDEKQFRGQHKKSYEHTHRAPVAPAGLLLLVKHVHVDDLIERQADAGAVRFGFGAGLERLDGWSARPARPDMQVGADREQGRVPPRVRDTSAADAVRARQVCGGGADAGRRPLGRCPQLQHDASGDRDGCLLTPDHRTATTATGLYVLSRTIAPNPSLDDGQLPQCEVTHLIETSARERGVICEGTQPSILSVYAALTGSRRAVTRAPRDESVRHSQT